MLEKEFERFLFSDPKINSAKAVASRMSRARKVEAVLGISLDIVVDTDDLMYDSLLKLSMKELATHSPMQNALRKYYIFKQKKNFQG